LEILQWRLSYFSFEKHSLSCRLKMSTGLQGACPLPPEPFLSGTQYILRVLAGAENERGSE
jgi:hypothetical protein